MSSFWEIFTIKRHDIRDVRPSYKVSKCGFLGFILEIGACGTVFLMLGNNAAALCRTQQCTKVRQNYVCRLCVRERERTTSHFPWILCTIKTYPNYQIQPFYFARLEAIATRLEAIATRVEAIALRLEAIAIRFLKVLFTLPGSSALPPASSLSATWPWRANTRASIGGQGLGSGASWEWHKLHMECVFVNFVLKTIYKPIYYTFILYVVFLAGFHPESVYLCLWEDKLHKCHGRIWQVGCAHFAYVWF